MTAAEWLRVDRSWHALRCAVRAVTAGPGWDRGRVHVGVLRGDLATRYAGFAGPGRVLLPRSGTYDTVAHELAHVACYAERHVDHGPCWRAEYVRIADLLVRWGVGCRS